MDRCRWLSDVHFHSSTVLTAFSRPNPEDRQDNQGSDTHHLMDDPGSLPSGQEQQQQQHHDMQKIAEFSKAVMGDLQNIFGLHEKDAQDVLISSHSPDITERDICHNLHSLEKCGIAGTQIKRIPWILAHKSDVLSEKLAKIKEPYLFWEHSEGLGFCYLSMEQINMYQKYFKKESPKFPSHPNRIYYLAERLKVPVELLTEKIGKAHRTLTINMQKVDSIIDLFHRYGMSSEYIVSNLRVFGSSPSKAEDRLRRLTELGCTELRPWRCRCSDKKFDKFCERYHNEKELLGEHKDLISYLSERLDCEPSILKEAFQRNTVMKSVRISKFSKILDLLFAEGITTKQISSCMKVFQYSEERTATRIKELKKIGFFPFPLIILCHTPAQFQKIVAQSVNWNDEYQRKGREVDGEMSLRQIHKELEQQTKTGKELYKATTTDLQETVKGNEE